MPKKVASGELVIKPLVIERVHLKIIGDSELIMHQWSKKAKTEMLAKQQGLHRGPKSKKNPWRDYIESMYWFDPPMPTIALNNDGGEEEVDDASLPTPEDIEKAVFGFPATSFKGALVGACRLNDGLPMTVAKVAMRVEGDLIPIDGHPRIREDMVRLETGVADIRYRGGFPRWRAVLPITFMSNIITLDQLGNLLNAAGQCGIGEWRPSAPKSATGTMGTFHVATEEEWEAWRP